jgi:hypothetical protein
LFDSRTDDSMRGGDFDLLVWAPAGDALRLYDAKLSFLADLHATPAFEDERIDVVLGAPGLDPEPRPIQLAAMTHGLELHL